MITTPVHFFIKGQDRAPSCWQSTGSTWAGSCPAGTVQATGLDAQAVSDGVTVAPTTWTGCGVWNGHRYGHSDYTDCSQWGSSATLLVENYYQLRGALRNGYRGTAMYDVEPWSYTPDYQWQDPAKWLTAAAKLAHAYHVYLIETVNGKALNNCKTDAIAVRAGVNAFMIGFQSQGKPPAGTTWNSWVASWVKCLRNARAKAGTHTLLMGGLATNVPTIHTYTAVLYPEYYELTQRLAISNIWLNANNWGPSDKCAADPNSGGVGCPEYGVQLLHHALPDTLLASGQLTKALVAPAA